MTDTLTPDRRSWNMSRIRGKDTKPERMVRSMLHSMGYRFTVNGPKNRELPGKPDIVLLRFNTVIFVHGCFWHRHKGCRYAYTPKSRIQFWQKKFDSNVTNDRKVSRQLRSLGWRVVVIWECQITRAPEQVQKRLARVLAPDNL